MRSIASFLAAAALAVGLAASAPAFAQQHKVVVDGNLWLASTPETRRVFLIGAANMIALESAYSKRKGTPLPTVSAMTAKAVDGMTLDQISQRITRWYEANPGRHSMPVMGVLWTDIVAPGGASK